MKSLAEHLGTLDPRTPDAPRPTPTHYTSAKAFAQDVLNSQEYRDHLYRLLLLDELPPAVECLLYHYAYGKPVERVEVTETPVDLDDLSIEQLEARALQTLEFVRRHRKQEESGSVH